MSSALRIIVTGLIAQHPKIGGITWHYLQYLLGLQRLGHDVYYLEDSGEHTYDLDFSERERDRSPDNCTYNVAYLEKILNRYGLGNKWAYRFPQKSEWYGLSNIQRKELIASTDLLINISGTLENPGKYRQIPHLVYIDTDPIVTQIKMVVKSDLFFPRVNAHDTHFSFGETIRESEFNKAIDWQPTRQPIVLAEWQPTNARHGRFTTVMSWTSYPPLTYAGQTFGQKDVEFKRFLELPHMVAPVELEIALSSSQHLEWQDNENKLPQKNAGIDEGERITDPHILLRDAGWWVIDSIESCGDLDSYREYIQRSKAEWSVAKNAYVLGQPGWFSERSACYLASGKPVVVQDTGFSNVIPTGDGILTFRNIEEAVEAIDHMESRYGIHAEAAREIAEEYFDSDKVLPYLIDRL